MHANKRAEKIHGRGATGKAVVMGMLERGGQVRVKVVAKRNKKTLLNEIKKNVAPGSEIFSDELLSYWGLNQEFIHQIINHAEEYVRGNVHTNGMENFWSLLKRGLNGTYISVEPFHLFRYLDEQLFRYNYRELTDGERFVMVLQQVVGKRLTYADLTGKTEAV